jgi:uncharacterized protein YecE (DUF72 family)
MNPSEIKVGIAGWSYPDWEGIVYPDSKCSRLTYAASFVDVIEINSTFYRPALCRDSQVWLNQTQRFTDFFFTAKLHQDFTHNGLFDKSFIDGFKAGLSPLLEAGKLRQLLAQFRYDFDDTADHRSRLEIIAGIFSSVCPLAVEVRHRSWQKSEAAEFLRDLPVSVCHLDYPVGPDSYNPDGTESIGAHGYFRMHGRNAEKWFSHSTRDETYDYYYTPRELEDILKKIERLADHCQTYTLIANNHYKGAELANALQIKAMLSGLKQRFPEGLLLQYPELAHYAENSILF